MFRQVFSAGLAAGIVVGLLISVLHHFTTTPLILHAESFEQTQANQITTRFDNRFYRHALLHDYAGQYFIKVHSDAPHATDDAVSAWAPDDGLERTFYTAVSTIITSIGFAMLLVACYSVWSQPVTARTGILWGAAGFVVFSLSPSLGLPPEIPGGIAAEINGRQTWWVLCVVCTAAALWLMVFSQYWSLRIAGIILLVLPHYIGAPMPDASLIGTASAPAMLAAHFVATSIAIGGVFWVLLGWFSGYFFHRFERA